MRKQGFTKDTRGSAMHSIHPQCLEKNQYLQARALTSCDMQAQPLTCMVFHSADISGSTSPALLPLCHIF